MVWNDIKSTSHPQGLLELLMERMRVLAFEIFNSGGL